MLDYDSVKRDVVGRWDGIFASLGIEVGDGRHTSCPVCGGKDRFRYDNKDGKGTWYCSQCVPSAGDGWSLIQGVLNVSFKEALEEVGSLVGSVEISNVPKKEKSVSPSFLRKIFCESEPASENNLVGTYLSGRGLSVVPGCLRYSKSCYEPETKKEQKAMLAVFSNKDGAAVTMHRTFLDDGGEKLNIEKQKKILPALEKMTGGAVRLFEPDGGVLGIAEGIETAIAVHESVMLPVWACLSASLLEGFDPPPGIKHVAIFADNDRNYAGQRSAYILANKLMTRKSPIAAEVFIPPRPGEDWLDDYLSRKES